ncbi:MAG: hypothetical protein D6753_00260 [Planctomycetota bacterium]|nr:MAG: hypothetical protein D6753_00260 [Planctomycetota bacterium]
MKHVLMVLALLGLFSVGCNKDAGTSGTDTPAAGAGADTGAEGGSDTTAGGEESADAGDAGSESN